MGLNDGFLIDTSAEPEPKHVTINALKDTVAGEQPELKDSIDLIAINEVEKEGEDVSKEIAAIEELLIRSRDLEILQQSLRARKGMNQQAALECHAIIPDFLNETRPVGAFTQQITNTGYQAALEEVNKNQSKLVNGVIEIIRKIVAKIKEKIKSFFGGDQQKKIADAWEKSQQEEMAAQAAAKKANDLSQEAKDKIHSVISTHISPEYAGAMFYVGDQDNSKQVSDIINHMDFLDLLHDASLNASKLDYWQKEQANIEKNCDAFEAGIAQARQDGQAAIDKYFEKEALVSEVSKKSYFRNANLNKSIEKSLDIANRAVSTLDKLEKELVSKNADVDEIHQTRDALYLANRLLSNVKTIVKVYEGYAKLNTAVSKIKRADFDARGNAANEEFEQLAEEGKEVKPPYEETKKDIEYDEPTRQELEDEVQELIEASEAYKQAIEQLRSGSSVGTEALDVITKGMSPKQALNYSFALEEESSKEKLEQEKEKVDKSILQKLKDKLSALKEKVFGAKQFFGAKNFSLFGPRKIKDVEGVAVVVEKILKKKYPKDPARLGSSLLWLGKKHNAVLTMKFVKAIRLCADTDFFNSSALNRNTDVLNDAMNAFYDGYEEREQYSDLKDVVEKITAGVSGNTSGYFSDMEAIFKETQKAYEPLMHVTERVLPAYLRKAEKEGWDNDIRLFNLVMKNYKMYIDKLIWITQIYTVHEDMVKEVASLK